jgi:hypothetical protein
MNYRGEVTRIDEEGVHVTCPDLGLDLEFGPLECVVHPVPPIVGDRVLLTSVGGIRDDLVVVGVLTLVATTP